MKILDYLEHEKKLMDDFADYWVKQNKMYPDQFPEDMTEAEWWDQYRAWMTDTPLFNESS
jgi:hypothetical protein